MVLECLLTPGVQVGWDALRIRGAARDQLVQLLLLLLVHLEELCLDLLQLFDRDARLLQHRQKGLRRFTDQSVDLLNDSDRVLVLLHFRLVNHDQLFKGVLWGSLLLLLLEGHELLELLGLLQLLLRGHLTVGGLD